MSTLLYFKEYGSFSGEYWHRKQSLPGLMKPGGSGLRKVQTGPGKVNNVRLFYTANRLN